MNPFFIPCNLREGCKVYAVIIICVGGLGDSVVEGWSYVARCTQTTCKSEQEIKHGWTACDVSLHPARNE
jgi:hypothetical protein